MGRLLSGAALRTGRTGVRNSGQRYYEIRPNFRNFRSPSGITEAARQGPEDADPIARGDEHLVPIEHTRQTGWAIAARLDAD
jgi:hypothetical protein